MSPSICLDPLRTPFRRNTKKTEGGFYLGLRKENFESAKRLLLEVAEYIGMKEREDTVVHIAEDETRVQEKLNPDFTNHIVVGSCGLTCHEHCDFTQGVIHFRDVGNIAEIFEHTQTCDLSPVPVPCSIRSSPPCFPLAILPTCLRFGSLDIERQ